jgi:serine protease Do
MAAQKQHKRPHIGLLILFCLVAILGLQKLLTTSNETSNHTVDTTPASKVVLTQHTPSPTAANVENPFVYAAQRAIPCVVHITAKQGPKTVQRGNNNLEDILKEFFGEGFDMRPREYKSKPTASFGSGVIMSEDGLIVTNNHVIEDADTLEVTLNDNRRYTAKLIGADPDTDLALLKIEVKNFPYLSFGDSEKAEVGQDVILVGNPFNLTSTVTKGIVSAKARRPNLSKSGGRVTIESFIQTDAAANPGNSGGALVDMQGNVIGIVSAISSPTGAFAGYAFAIPSSIAQPVIEDFKKYGAVKRAILGIFPIDVNADLVAEKKLHRFDGVYIAKFTESSPAAEAGLREGDILIGINHIKIKNLAQLYEALANYKPGDEVKVVIDRKGKEMTIPVKLRSAINEIKVVRRNNEIEIEGATFRAPDVALKERLGLQGGAQIKALKPGKFQQAGIKKDFIITAIDKEKIDSLDQLATILNVKKGGILIEGVYPNGTKGYYGIGWSDL